MTDTLRDLFGLTQERLASWLGVNRTTVADAEAGRRALPSGRGGQEARLLLASRRPAPVIVREPLQHRLADCQHHLRSLAYRLKLMQAKATQLEARLAALPALRAYPGAVKNPTREAGWLALFEGEAVDGLRDECGAGPQALLLARMAGLEREADLLRAALAAAEAAAP